MKNLKLYIKSLFFVVSIFASIQAWGASKTWAGTTGAWDTAGHWSPSGVPTASDEVTITSGTPEITTAAQAKSITVNSGASLKLTSGSLTVENITNNGTVNADADITVSGNFTNNGTFTHGSKKVIFNGSTAKISGSSETQFYHLEISSGTLTLEKEIKIENEFTNNGTFTHGTKKVSFNGSTAKISGSSETQFYHLEISSGTLTLEKEIKIENEFTNNGTFTHGSKKVIFNGSTAKISGSSETQFYHLEISSGTLTLEKEIKIENEFTNNGTFTHGNKAVTLDNTKDIKITGTTTASNTKFYELKMTNAGGKKLELHNNITVDHNLQLTGTSKTALLEISGTGEIHLTHTSNTGQYLSVKSDTVEIKTTTYSIADSKKTDNKRPENQTEKGWSFTAMSFDWQGTSTDWNNTSNWDFGAVPAKYDTVTISTKTHYPKLETSTHAKAKEVTVNTGAELDLNTETIAADSGNAKLTMNGTLKLTGTSNQKTWFEATGNKIELNQTSSTVAYYTNTDADMYKGPYCTLIIKDGKKVSSSDAITAKDCTVTGEINATLTVSNNLTASDSAKFKAVTVTNDFTVNGSTSGTETVFEGAVTTKNLTVNAGRKLTANADMTISGDFTNNGEFQSSTHTVTFTGADSKLQGSGANTKFYNITNSSKLTVTKDITVLHDFTANGETILNHNHTIAVENDFVANADVTLHKDLTTKNISVNDSKHLTAKGNITLTGNFKNDGVFTAGTDTTVTCKGTPSKIYGTTSLVTPFYDLTTETGSSLQIEQQIKIENKFTANTDVTLTRDLTAKNIEIGASKTFTANANITVSGEFTNNGTFTHGNKKVLFDGTDTKITGTTTFYDLEIAAGKKLTASSPITVHAHLTNNGTFESTSTVTLTPSGTDITVTGSDDPDKTKFTDVVCSNAGGKNLVLHKNMTVTGNLTLSGSNESSLLTVKTTTNAQLTLNADKTGGNHLEVHSNIPIANHTYTITHSKIYEVSGFPITAGNPKNWIFDGCISGTFYWKGTVDTNWETEKNWLPYCKPDERTAIIIPKEDVTQFPKLTGDVKAVSVAINENAELDLADYIIKTTGGHTAKLTDNGGILKLTGTTPQKNWFQNSNDSYKLTLLGNTTVEYYGAASADMYHGNYYNVTIRDTKTISSDTAIHVTNHFTAAGTITLNTDLHTKNAAINSGGTLTANADITVNGDFTNDGAFAPGTKTVKFTGADSKLQGTASFSTFYTILIDSGTLTLGQQATVLHDVTAHSTAIVDKPLTVNNHFIVNAAVTLNDALTAKDITINASKTFTANADITVTGEFKNNGTFTHGNKKVLFDGTDTKITGTTPFYDLEIAAGKKLTASSPITVQAHLTNNGTFIANAIMTLSGNFTNTGTFKSISDTNVIFSGDVITITGVDNEADTEFKNIICNNAKNKKLIFSKKIKVSGDLKLSGTAEGALVIDGTHNAAIYLNDYQTDNGRYLQIHTSNIRINDGGFTIYYIVKDSTDNIHTQQNKNGWVFYKTFAIANSFIRAGDNKLYIVIQEPMYENEFTYSNLEITDTATSSVIASGSTYRPYTTHTFTDTSYRTVWEYTLNQHISADTILNKNIHIRLYYFDKEFSKKYISDIGIDMVKVLFAANSRTIRDFSGNADLPKLNTTIPITSVASSQNIRLYFDHDKQVFWYPQLAGIKHTFDSKDPITADTESITTAEEFAAIQEHGSLKFMIPSDTPNFKENGVAQFMFVYDDWLPCANLKNSSDPLSFDVWKFNVLGVSSQRGGVSIYNNVINIDKDEKVSFQLTLQKAGTVTIQIMTIDGSIVKTVERSHKDAGTHFYEWDGKNNAGNYITRGLYFIRIAAPDIDEIRKVMLIKN